MESVYKSLRLLWRSRFTQRTPSRRLSSFRLFVSLHWSTRESEPGLPEVLVLASQFWRNCTSCQASALGPASRKRFTRTLLTSRTPLRPPVQGADCHPSAAAGERAPPPWETSSARSRYARYVGRCSERLKIPTFSELFLPSPGLLLVFIAKRLAALCEELQANGIRFLNVHDGLACTHTRHTAGMEKRQERAQQKASQVSTLVGDVGMPGHLSRLIKQCLEGQFSGLGLVSRQVYGSEVMAASRDSRGRGPPQPSSSSR